MEIIENIQITDNVYLPIIKGHVGLSLSGGADSALLLYLLLKHKKDLLTIFTLSDINEKSLPAAQTPLIIQKCIELTGNKNVLHIVEYKDKKNEDVLFETPVNYLKENTINVIYTGFTTNPPDHVLATFKNKISDKFYKDRHPSFIKEVVYKEFCAPFANIDKMGICKIYQQYNLMESLFPLTRSCSWSERIKNTTIPVNNEHCKMCWTCEERFWGFNRYK